MLGLVVSVVVSMFSRMFPVRYLTPLVVKMVTSLTCVATIVVAFPLYASATVPVTAGDGGIVEEQCGETPVHIRVDSADVPGRSACFGLKKESGWIALNITGSYGVVNNLTVPVNVSFKLPNGAVYWSVTVDPGKVKTIDVNRGGSTVVELQVAPVGSPSGPGNGSLVPTLSGENDNVVSLRSSRRESFGAYLRVGWSGVYAETMSRNSGFTDRIDASFRVVEGLSNIGCISLESAAYPGTYLEAVDVVAGAGLRVSAEPRATYATWCVSPVAVPPTGQRLVSAVDQRFAISTDGEGRVSMTTTRAVDSVWFADQALAFPGV
ncbi:AbfB domain-containing protein [Corynebacterium sp. NPDC060344]|uniref:AbfB domain-containing protein n=1 Tax=Corynebacterium sp. NPDC060344 TaxID=3347101 RepID=UPI0036696283